MNALQQFRVARQLSYEALGELLGVDKGRAHQWCCGNRSLPATRVLDVEAATGIPRVILRPDIYGERLVDKPAKRSALPGSAPC